MTEISPRTSESIYIALGSITFVLNFLAIVFILRGRKKLKFHEKFLVSLAFSDLLVAFLVTVYKIFDISISGEEELLGEDTFSILLSSSVMLSIVNLLVITVDRFLAVKYPLKHHARSSVVNTNAIIGLIWFLEVGKSIALLYLSVRKKIEEEVLLYFTAVSIIAFSLLMTAVYMYIVHKSCARRTMLNSQGATHGQIVNSFFCEDFKKERHIFYTCCLINFTFITCSYPFAIQYLIRVSADPEEYTISRLMLFLNSTLNPLVYFFKGYLERRKTDNSVAVVQRH